VLFKTRKIDPIYFGKYNSIENPGNPYCPYTSGENTVPGACG